MSSPIIDKKLWNVIHIIGKTFSSKDRESREAFFCFFECLSDLLPNNEYRKTLKEFMTQSPPNPDNAFQWTYSLHSYVNFIKRRRGQSTSDITFEKLNSLYSNVNKTDWGNAIWFLMHYISVNLPEVLTANQQTSFVALIMCIKFLLPCGKCKYHMTEYISSNDIKPFLSSGKACFQWTWIFHNGVSKRLNKQQISFDEAYNMYLIRRENENGVYSMIDY